VCTNFKVQFSGRVVQWYKRGMDYEAYFWDSFWCAISGFLLLEIVILLLICIFLKLNNKISLSLSHWVSPHWIFPWHLPKIMSYSWVIECCSLCLFPLHNYLAMCISSYGNF
jgi:hypothetical protein